MATASLIAHTVGLSEYDTRHLQVAALTHDVLTPAGGDTVKFIDPDAFDEDAHYKEVFQNNPEWEEVRERYRLDEALLTETVLGRGVLGGLLDVADKTTYVAHDLDAYIMSNDPRGFQNFKAPKSIMDVWQFREELGHPGSALWNDVAVIGEQVVFTNGKRLADFLMLRALMFHHLYYNPKARYREQMLGVLIVDPLYSDGVLTRDMLLQMDDHGLERVIERETGLRDMSWELCRSDVAPDVEEFPTIEAAKERARLRTTMDPTLLVMWETFPPVSEKAVRYLVLDHTGMVRPFKEVYPDETREILALGSDPNPVKLYLLHEKKVAGILPFALRTKLLEKQRERLGLAVHLP